MSQALSNTIEIIHRHAHHHGHPPHRTTATAPQPGESAQIQRILEGFAAAFYAQNKTSQRPNSLTSTRTDPWVRGWYVEPIVTDKGAQCCVHCGALEEQVDGDLRPCSGCEAVSFCRTCRYMAHRRGHAVVGMVGYGRACVQARRNAGTLDVEEETGTARMHFGQSVDDHPSPPIVSAPSTACSATRPLATSPSRLLVHSPTYQLTFSCSYPLTPDRDGKETPGSEVVTDDYNWPRVSPFLSEDAVMVLAYSIIMLT